MSLVACGYIGLVIIESADRLLVLGKRHANGEERPKTDRERASCEDDPCRRNIWRRWPPFVRRAVGFVDSDLRAWQGCNGQR